MSVVDRQTKINVFRRDGFKCLLCHSKTHLTIDHIVPRGHGGTDEEDNLQTLCEYHNRRKGSKNTKDYRGKRGLPAMNPYMCER